MWCCKIIKNKKKNICTIDCTQLQQQVGAKLFNLQIYLVKMGPHEDDVNDASDGDADAESLHRMTEMKASRASAKGNMCRIKALITKKAQKNLSTDDLQCRLEIF